MLAIVAYVAFILLAVVVAAGLVAPLRWRKQDGRKHVAVVVLGDIGRSPRMQYHALSLCKEGFDVEFVGYGGSVPMKDLVDSPNVKFHYLSEPSRRFKGSCMILDFSIKVLYQTATLLWTMLFRISKCSSIIVQTPPAVPTLFAVWLVCRMKDSQMVIDWHNYGYTLMALPLGKDHLFVKIAKYFEAVFGYMADHSYCVTQAMRKDLIANWNISAKVLYDRPTEKFRPSNPKEQHELFMKISQTVPDFCSIDGDPNSTVFTTYNPSENSVTFKKDRPFLIISSTSWTEDEDFSILLKALEGYDQAATRADNLPSIICVITGKGPLKEYYEKIMKEKNFLNVKMCTLWLSPENYTLLMGSANLGVSLHKSSSGLDLPMKIVDMFGSGLPVCALQFYCIEELVKHNRNGLVFADENVLAEQIQDLAANFPGVNKQMNKFKDDLNSFQSLRWDHFWKIHVLPGLG